MASDGSAPPADATPLDDEIAELEAQAESLRKALKIQCSTILSSSAAAAEQRGKLAVRAERQLAFMQQSSYRTCTPVTAFKVRDPDPAAVDGGHVLGLRFEVMSRGQFLQPYYVMLNRPYSSPSASSPTSSSSSSRATNKYLRIHRHTVPPAVPLAGLAARHLPAPRPDDDSQSQQPRQDLDRFVRSLRREIMRYHNRLGVAADLRRRLGLPRAGNDGGSNNDNNDNAVVDVSIADIEAKQIKLAWADERSGRLVMDDDGKVLKLVVFGAQGRDWETAKELFGNYDRMEDIARKLEDHGAAAG